MRHASVCMDNKDNNLGSAVNAYFDPAALSIRYDMTPIRSLITTDDDFAHFTSHIVNFQVYSHLCMRG